MAMPLDYSLAPLNQFLPAGYGTPSAVGSSVPLDAGGGMPPRPMPMVVPRALRMPWAMLSAGGRGLPYAPGTMGALFGYGSGGGGSAYGQDQSARDRDAYERGQANLTAGNVMRGLGIAGSFVNPSFGAFLGAGRLISNPNPFTGFVGPTPLGRSILARGGTLEDAQAADRAIAAATHAIASGLGMHVGHPGGEGGFGGGSAGGARPGSGGSEGASARSGGVF